MAKKSKKANSTELDGLEFFKAIAEIEEKKKIKQGYMLDKISQALLAAYRKDHEGVEENLTLDIDEKAGIVRMILRKEVVEEVENSGMEMTLEEAREIRPNAQIGEIVQMEIKPKNFGRIAAQAARQVIIQGIREAEQGMVFEELNSKEHEILSGTIMRIDPKTASVVLHLGTDTTDTYLSLGEQVQGEVYEEGARLKVYVVEVRRSAKGPQILISRTHPGLVKRLFESEVPEIYDGTVEIRSIAREAGSRTKLAVWSSDPNVEPIGACVGSRGARVNAIVKELNGEKIDIVKYSEDPSQYIAAALAPSDVLSVTPLEDGKRCRVIVPDDQLSLAIGREGQNARLAAKLTGFKIDIKSQSMVDADFSAPSQDQVVEIENVDTTTDFVEETRSEEVETMSDVVETPPLAEIPPTEESTSTVEE